MFRRARFSVKPNVKASAAGRGNSGGCASVPAAVLAPASAPDPEAEHVLCSSTCSPEAAGGSADQLGDVAKDLQQGRGNSKERGRDEETNTNGDRDGSKRAETLPQRRKRISTIPNIAKPRVVPPSTRRTVSSASKCSPKQAPLSPSVGTPFLQKELSSPEKIIVENSPKSPILPEKKTPVPQVPQFSPFKKSISKEPNACITAQRSEDALQKNISSPLKERPTQEKTIQEEIPHTKSASGPEKRMYSDREKIVKAQKLRKLLKEELRKEKQQQKYKCSIIEKHMPEDRSKMIMRDFIYYLPENNPMKSSLVEEKKTEKTSTVTQAKEAEIIADHENGNEEAEEEEEEEEEEEDDGPLLVPRVKVAEDGSIILDEESLTVEVLRTKGQSVVEENDPIFERGSTTTYSSFRKSYYTKPWSEKETDMFFLAISMVGTDFSMISQLFPHRARTEIKNKFKREEKVNGWRIDKAFKDKKPFDFHFFTKLLEKVLENERKKKEKDAKCQHQKEKKTNEKEASKSYKKQKAKVVSGQANDGQNDEHNSRILEVEMEVDAGTAEKENEASPALLEQIEGQAVTESVMLKKKRKRRKKDSEQEVESLPEEETVSAEVAERGRPRGKRKKISSVEINGEELEIPEQETPDEILPSVEEAPQRSIHLNEEAEEDNNLNLLSTHKESAFMGAESDELDISKGGSKNHTEQPSESLISSNPVKGNEAGENEAAELAKLAENQYGLASSLEGELMETECTVTEDPTVGKVVQQGLTSSLTKISEERELSVSEISEVVVTPSEFADGTGKNDDLMELSIEDKDKSNNSMDNELRKTQNASIEKTEVRSRRQRPKPNIARASVRKEAPVQSKLDKPEPDRIIEKNSDRDGTFVTEGSAEKDGQTLDAEFPSCKKSTSQECSKQTVLKPALLARGRMQKPKPNLGKAAKRQMEPARNAETEEEKTHKGPTELTKTMIQVQHSSSEYLTLPTMGTTCCETDLQLSDELENHTAMVSSDTSKSPVETSLEHECHKVKNPLVLNNNIVDMADLTRRESILQQEEIPDKMEHALKSNLSQKDNLVAERQESLQAEQEISVIAEEGLVSNEAAKCGILSSAVFSEECSANTQEAVETKIALLSPQELSDIKETQPNEHLPSQDIQEKTSVGKQGNVHPTPLFRGRFQRPKPNIGRVGGRKETQPMGHEASIFARTKKSVFTGSPTTAQIQHDDEVLLAEALDERPANTRNVILEDSQMPSTSQNISVQCSRNVSQEEKPCTIKPAQLTRGRFQRTRPNFGKKNDKRGEPVLENIKPSDLGEEKKTAKQIVEEDGLQLLSEGDVDVQPSLDELEEESKSESTETGSLKRCVVEKEVSSPEKPQECEPMEGKREMFVAKEAEGKHLDISDSEISESQQEISKNIKSTGLMRRHLQKLRPNLTQAAKKKESFSEETYTKDKIERQTENTTSCSTLPGSISSLVHSTGKWEETVSPSSSVVQEAAMDSTETVLPSHSRKCDSLEPSSGTESPNKKQTSQHLLIKDGVFKALKGKQTRETSKWRKNVCESRTSFTSEHENNHSEKGKNHSRVKSNASRGRNLKSSLRRKPKKDHGSSKVNLVTLRASSQEEEDEDDDGDDFEPDYEIDCFSPEEVNKAPVFVPKGLRSPNPVPVQIEETMEELEIYENVPDEPCFSHELHAVVQPAMEGEKPLYLSQMVTAQEEQENKTGINDGSTEAAMTLLAMRDPAFQLNIATQEFSNTHRIIVTDINKDQNVVHCNVPCSAPSKHEPLSSENMNESVREDHHTEPADLQHCLQETNNKSLPDSSKNEAISSHSAPGHCNVTSTEELLEKETRVTSDSSLSKENKSSKPVRCRFSKPKPNLNRGLNRKSKAPGLISQVTQFKDIENEQNMRQEAAGEQTVELEQNLRLNEMTMNPSACNYELDPRSAGCPLADSNMESMVGKTWEVASESTTPKLYQEEEMYSLELPSNPSSSINVQISDPTDHHMATVEVAQTETTIYSNTTEMIPVSGSIEECPKGGEEPTFILTLVEISADSENGTGLLQQTSEEMLPAPMFFTSDNTPSRDLTRKDNTSETGRFQAASQDHLEGVSSTSWKNLKKCEDLEESGSPEQKKPSPAREDLESSIEDIPVKSRCISLKVAGKNSEKMSVSKTENSPTSRALPETRGLKMAEDEQPQSSANLEALVLDEAVAVDEEITKMSLAGTTMLTENQSDFVDTCKPVQSEQAGSTAAFLKSPLSRPHQRLLGFLPLICKNNSHEELPNKGSKQSLQKLHPPDSKSILECPIPLGTEDKKDTQDSSSTSSIILLPSNNENNSSSTVQDFSEAHGSEGSSKEQEKEEEPTRISEYFFSDIFMEVDDSE